MVGRSAVGKRAEPMRAEFFGRRRRGSVGFDQQSIRRQLREHRATGSVPGGEKGTVEGKERAEIQEVARKIGRTSIRVKQKSASGPTRAAQGVGERAPRVEAMNRHRQ